MFTSFIVFVVVSGFVSGAPPDWKCGTSGTEDLSYNIVKFECPTALLGIGNCCTVHDSKAILIAFETFICVFRLL